MTVAVADTNAAQWLLSQVVTWLQKSFGSGTHGFSLEKISKVHHEN